MDTTRTPCLVVSYLNAESLDREGGRALVSDYCIAPTSRDIRRAAAFFMSVAGTPAHCLDQQSRSCFEHRRILL